MTYPKDVNPTDCRFLPRKPLSPNPLNGKSIRFVAWASARIVTRSWGRRYFPYTRDCINTEYQLSCISEYRMGGAA